MYLWCLLDLLKFNSCTMHMVFFLCHISFSTSYCDKWNPLCFHTGSMTDRDTWLFFACNTTYVMGGTLTYIAGIKCQLPDKLTVGRTNMGHTNTKFIALLPVMLLYRLSVICHSHTRLASVQQSSVSSS